MKLNETIATVEQAQKLKKLGVEQKSIFYHEYVEASVGTGGWAGWNTNYLGKTVYEKYSAFTMAELLLILPDSSLAVPYKNGSIDTGSEVFTQFTIRVNKISQNTYHVAMVSISDVVIHGYYTPYPTHGLAEMLIYLLEHGLYSISEVNARLQS